MLRPMMHFSDMSNDYEIRDLGDFNPPKYETYWSYNFSFLKREMKFRVQGPPCTQNEHKVHKIHKLEK